MKLLVDQNLSHRLVPMIIQNFPGSVHVSDCGLAGCPDKAIWNFAKKNNYTILTLDADFFDLTQVLKSPPKVIWLRSGNRNTKTLAAFLISKKSIIVSFLRNPNPFSKACLELSLS